MENSETLKSKFGFWLEQVGEGATSYWLVYGTTTLDGKPRPASDEEIILWESALSAQREEAKHCECCDQVHRAVEKHYGKPVSIGKVLEDLTRLESSHAPEGGDVQQLKSLNADLTMELHSILDKRERDRIPENEMMHLLRRVNREFENEIKDLRQELSMYRAKLPAPEGMGRDALRIVDDFLVKHCTGMDDHDTPFGECWKCNEMRKELLVMLAHPTSESGRVEEQRPMSCYLKTAYEFSTQEDATRAMAMAKEILANYRASHSQPSGVRK